MTTPESKKLSPRKLPLGGRKATSVSMEALIKTSQLRPEWPLPLVVEPAMDGVNLASWAENNREWIDSNLLNYGGILFRGFAVNNTDDFEGFIKASSGEALEYKERSSPRSQVSGNIYTSTDYPADQTIFLHNENSYQQSWPLKLFFCCLIAAEQGGETPIANCRNVYNRIPADIRDRFIQKNVMYVRNFGDRFGLPWQTVFQTDDKAAVEAYCEKANIQAEWKPDGGLRTRTIRRAALKHPRTGDMTWFNHATFFHVSTLAPAIREALLADLKEEDLPSNSYYGDGTPIEPEVLDLLRQIYHEETIAFLWQKGDLLMLDNMFTAHGRAPFVGSRKVVVGMSEPVRSQDVQ